MAYLKITAFIVFLALVFSGCSSKTYAYKAPASAEGKKCIKTCHLDKKKCRDTERKEKAAEKKDCEKQSKLDYKECKNEFKADNSVCEADSEADYVACLKYAADRKTCKKKKCATKKMKCKKASCFINPKYRQCEIDYRECYTNCGGKVSVVEE